MLLGQIFNQLPDISSFGPHAGHDHMSARMIQFATPRAVIVIADPFGRDCVDFRMHGDQIGIKSIDCRMRFDTACVSFAQANVQFACLSVAKSLVRIPHS